MPTGDRINICYFVGTDGDCGGASRILFNLVRRIDRARFAPIVMLHRLGRICEELDGLGVQYHAWNVKERLAGIPFVRHALDCMRFYRNHRVDLIHLNHGCLGWRPAELWAARLMRIPVVVHCQQVVKKATPNVKSADIVLTCSKYLADKSDTADVPKRPIYDLVDLARFDVGKNMRGELGIAEDAVVFRFVGRTRRAKGVEMFVKLADAITQDKVRFLMTGQQVGVVTPDSYSHDEITRLVRHDNRIRYLGYRPDIENIYASSDVIVMPSQGDEPCAAVLLESGACGKPIIATRTGSTAEIITHGENGFLVERDDFDGMVGWARALADDSALRAEIGRTARKTVERRFVRAPQQEIEDIYLDLIGGGRGLPGNATSTV